MTAPARFSLPAKLTKLIFTLRLVSYSAVRCFTAKLIALAKEKKVIPDHRP